VRQIVAQRSAVSKRNDRRRLDDHAARGPTGSSGRRPAGSCRANAGACRYQEIRSSVRINLDVKNVLPALGSGTTLPVPLSIQVVAAGGVVDVAAVGEELPQAATAPVRATIATRSMVRMRQRSASDPAVTERPQGYADAPRWRSRSRSTTRHRRVRGARRVECNVLKGSRQRRSCRGAVTNGEARWA